MSSTAEQVLLSTTDYLAMERASDIRHERIGGEVIAMTGASRRHNLINGNVFAALHARLRNRPCEAYANDMRVKISDSGDYVYPDIVIACDGPRFEDEHLDTLLNPVLIVEVLSDSTAAYDRSSKFAAYRRLESLREYVLIAQNEVRVEHYLRQESAWLLTESGDLTDSVELPCIHCRLSLADIYDRIHSAA